MGEKPTLVLTGAGGKSTSLFRLAREHRGAVMLANTAHLAVEQAADADRHVILRTMEDLPDRELEGATLFTGTDNGKGRWSGIPEDLWQTLKEKADLWSLPLLFESDGSRCLPAKAWESYEPPIPSYADQVAVVSGLSALGEPLDEAHVFRSEIFSRLSGLELGTTVTPESLATVLAHPQGGRKNIPAGARAVCILNQADTAALQAQARKMASLLLKSFDAVLITSLKPDGAPIPSKPKRVPQGEFNGIHAVIEATGVVILAAGGSSRMGQPKLLLPWHGEALVRHSVQAALDAGLHPVVVTGCDGDAVSSAVNDLAVTVIHNPRWVEGQSTSVQCGLAAMPPGIGSVLFLLGDQPQTPPTLIRAMVEKHQQTLAPITCPLIEQQRGNPVLFDQSTFADFSSLTGDNGARLLFKRYDVDYVPWYDAEVIRDIDTPDDYQQISEK